MKKPFGRTDNQKTIQPGLYCYFLADARAENGLGLNKF
jgi:hypothetical protein